MTSASTFDPGLLRRLALATYRRLPRRARLFVLRTVAPAHTVGSLVMIEHAGRLLMLRQRHRRGWTLPGGLLARGENAQQAAVREVLEETGLVIEVGQPLTVVVEPHSRRVDVLFHVPVAHRPEAVPSSEALEAAWLTPTEGGPLDDSTTTALAAFTRALEDGAHAGHLLTPPTPRS